MGETDDEQIEQQEAPTRQRRITDKITVFVGLIDSHQVSYCREYRYGDGGSQQSPPTVRWQDHFQAASRPAEPILLLSEVFNLVVS